jgi:NAD(P)H dehydrogenase (quinone)
VARWAKGFPKLESGKELSDITVEINSRSYGMNDSDKAKHLVILCHPETDSFNAAVAAKYCAVVEECGQEAILHDLYQMRFDPVLRIEEQPGTRAFFQCPHVAYELSLVAKADIIVFIYPIWFGTPPAMLKGYVDRVLGSDFSFGAIRDRDKKSQLAGAHLLSFTSSGNSQIWLEEQGQWQSLIQVFDRYLEKAFSMASTAHVHFSSIVEGLSERFFLQYMEEVGQAAHKSCSIVSNDHCRAQVQRA